MVEEIDDAIEGAYRNAVQLNSQIGDECNRATEDQTEDIARQAETGQYSCRDVDCLWPCHHHVHQTNSRDFFWYPIGIEIAAEGCPYCQLFLEISRYYCSCYPRAEPTGLDRECKGLYAFQAVFGDKEMVELNTFSHCGGVEIELGEIPKLGPNVDRNICDASLPIPTIRGGIREDRRSSDAISIFKRWLRECRMRHPGCQTVAPKAVPRRILDCSDPHIVRLCSFPEEHTPKFVALSYCWGGAAVLQLDKTTLRSFTQGLLYRNLPLLFQDTMLLVRKLRIQYVWIDALCILQDDRGDKDREIALMSELFRGAFLVLVAASARSPRDGFLKASDSRWRPRSRLRYIWRTPKVAASSNAALDNVRFREKLHNRWVSDSCKHETIGGRAWTYQERLLAKRCLVFREDEVVFECRSTCWCECSSSGESCHGYFKSQLLAQTQVLDMISTAGLGHSPTAESSSESQSGEYRFWKAAVATYSRRKLTKARDRLPAISALAVVVQERTGDEYLSGLWKGDLLSQLMWYNLPSYSDGIKPYDTYVAPSWSWASVPAEIFYQPSLLDTDSYHATVEDAKCMLTGPNALGGVSDGYIILNGINCSAHAVIPRLSITGTPGIKLILENRVIHNAEGEHRGEFSFLDGLRVTSEPMKIGHGKPVKTLQRQCVSNETEQETCSGKVRLLWLVEDVCLVLAYSRRLQGAYERIGILGRWMVPPMPDYLPSDIKIV